MNMKISQFWVKKPSINIGSHEKYRVHTCSHTVHNFVFSLEVSKNLVEKVSLRPARLVSTSIRPRTLAVVFILGTRVLGLGADLGSLLAPRVTLKGVDRPKVLTGTLSAFRALTLVTKSCPETPRRPRVGSVGGELRDLPF